jgi:phosphopantothenoylcysteine decarboxylase/phosphopantothenate--cysteine ligase
MRLLLGVSGGIAAYKAVETVRLAIRRGHAVRVIQTPASRRFVGAATFAGITGAPVLTGEFEDDPARGAYPGEPAPDHAPISHLALVERADVYLVAPASANTIAKLAHGAADTLLTAAALAADCPVIVAPAMNNRMYLHPATQANLRTLAERGVIVLDPGTGALASRGEHGIGRLPEPEQLVQAAERALAGDRAGPTDWAGLSVLVTAGGTREPIDPVRFLGNRSSGRMGYALAQAAAARGARVTVIAANVPLPTPEGVELVSVSTAAELAAAAETRFADADILLMAAAVADFRPARPAEHKLKKTAADAPRTLELEPVPDILSSLAARRRPGQTLVGFAAEHGAGAVAYGREKLRRKSLDAVVVNDVSRPEIGFDATENEVVILTNAGERALPRSPKLEVARAILDEVTRLRDSGEAHGAARTAAVGAARP